MAKVVTANTSANSVTLSASAWGAVSNAVVSHYTTVNSINIELLMANYLAQGLRHSADNRMAEGQKTKGGITPTYLEGTLIPNSE